MNATSHRFTEAERSGNALFIVLVVVSYVITFSAGLEDLTPLKTGALIALGVAYTLVGIYFGAFCERSGSTVAMAAYFAIEILMGTLILCLSETRAYLVMLPLAGQSADWLPRRWTIVVCAFVLAGMAIAAAFFIANLVGPTGERLFPVSSGDFWITLLQNMLAYLMAILFVVLFVRVAVREREARAEVERLAAELRDANRQLREYAAQVEELATVEERNRLAREIHDGLGHHLTAINMQIQAGRAALEHDRALGLDALVKAQELAQGALSEVRRSVAALRASPLDNRSLQEAVGALVDECRAAGIATAFAVQGKVGPLPPQVELALYRAAQEGMTNMRKYAQASSAEVTLDYGDGSAIHLTVGDSGVGSDDPTGGYGLIGIRERVQLLGGTMDIETTPGEGFALRVEVPVALEEPGPGK